MSRVEKMLAEEKEQINQIQAPPELEDRLRHALDKTKKPRRTKSVIWKLVIAALILFSFVSYNYNAFAYYGKKIIGFDDFVTGTLSELNEAGMGQVVDESISLANGIELTINGLMSDENRMIVYYTFSDPSGKVDDTHVDFGPSKITGWFTNAQFEGLSGQMNPSKTELKGMMNFEPPSAFAKKLTLHFTERMNNNQLQEREITFPYDPNQAMQTTMKQTIDQKIEVDAGTLHFESIVASPTMTVIKGSTNVESIDRVMQPLEHIELIANGQPIGRLGSGISSSITGKDIELEFDALPQNLETLQLHVERFVGYDVLDKKFSLDDTNNQILADNRVLHINNISLNDEQVEITINTDEDVLLDEVFIGTNNELVPLNTTVRQQFIKNSDGIKKERTLIFNTSHNPETFHIGGMYYMKEYNELIDIPVD